MDRTAADPAARLAPHAVLLRRSATELQVGVDRSLVLPRAYSRVLRQLALGGPVEDLRRTATVDGLVDVAVDDLLVSLADARLLRPVHPTAQTAVRLVGAGPLGVRTARELVAAGFGTVYLADLPEHAAPAVPVRDLRRGRSARPDRLDQLAATLAGGAGDVQVRRTRHFLKPEGTAVALTLVAADGPEPDRLVTDLLSDHGAPHLLLRSAGDEVTVGPLVVPGATSCVRCADLARADRDERWPWLLDQLTRLPLAPSPTLLGWAAVTASVQALAYVAGGSPESLGHTLELSDADHALRFRAWPRHPDCPCRGA